MGILHSSDKPKDVVFVVWDGQVTWAHGISTCECFWLTRIGP
jgi:hypothetical protein